MVSEMFELSVVMRMPFLLFIPRLIPIFLSIKDTLINLHRTPKIFKVAQIIFQTSKIYKKQTSAKVYRGSLFIDWQKSDLPS